MGTYGFKSVKQEEVTMKHLRSTSKITCRTIPMTAESNLPFVKCCLMSGGTLDEGGEVCHTASEASQSLFEFFAAIKGVSYYTY
jgi:hypothetical protein